MCGGDAWKCKSTFAGRSGVTVTAVEAPDPKTVVYRLESPNSLFLRQLANVQCQVLVAHPDSVGADGNWATPIGTGPYALKDWRRADRTVLERADGYSRSDEPGSTDDSAREGTHPRRHVLITPRAHHADAR